MKPSEIKALALDEIQGLCTNCHDAEIRTKISTTMDNNINEEDSGLVSYQQIFFHILNSHNCLCDDCAEWNAGCGKAEMIRGER